MNPNDIPESIAAGAEQAGARAATVALLNREVQAIQKMRAICAKAIEQEAALGVRVCAPLFAAVDSILSTAVVEVAHAVYGGAA